MAFGTRFVSFVLCTLALVAPCSSAPGNIEQPADLCEFAAVEAAQTSGVPLNVLRAITLAETGKRREGDLRPWPWTVNMEGVGHWFDDEASALSYVERNAARGALSFDVGCFQINYKWHGQAFQSLEQLFDPVANAHYAARFLSELHAEFGDWALAAGAYHSRTPKYASRYRERFSRILQGLEPFDEYDSSHRTKLASAQTGNGFPLFVASSSQKATASLVPLSETATVRLIDISGQ